MQRMDHAAKVTFEDGVLKGLSKLSSEYIKSNVWMTFQDDPTAFNFPASDAIHAAPVGQRFSAYRFNMASFAAASRRTYRPTWTRSSGNHA
jgi:hypothetical protein